MADEKGETCGRFLADLGADVIRVEPPGGARSRRLPPFHGATSLSFAVRNANKRGVTLDLGAPADRERLLALLESADVWIETTRPGTLAALGLGPDDVLARNPRARDHVDHRLRPERRLPRLGGQRLGPGGHERASSAARAWPGAIPCRTPPGMAYETAAIQAAWATLVAYWNRLETGRGDHVDFSILEATAQIMDPAYGAASVEPRVRLPVDRAGVRQAGLYPIFPCADGYVRVVVLAPRQWRAMRAWLGEPAAFQDERYDTITARLEASAELHGLYAALFAGHDEGRDRGRGPGARRAGRAGARRLRGARSAALRRRAGRSSTPRSRRACTAGCRAGSSTVDGVRAGFRHRAPEPGEHNDDLARAPGERLGAASRGRRAPRAAPAARRAARRRLRDHRHRQRDRPAARRPGRRRDQDREPRLPRRGARRATAAGCRTASSPAAATSAASASNLRTPEGVALLKRLVADADVVLENFKPGTLERLGLGYESLRAVNPDLVMLSTNALGSTGPWSRWLGYGPIVRCVSGIASLWRYPEDELGFGEPTTIYPDHYGARVCATAVLAALIRAPAHRRGALPRESHRPS